MKTKILSVLIGIWISMNLNAQDLEKYKAQIKAYEPSETHPFGQMNPAAPAETAQFDFMIGICDCLDSIRNPDGTWISFPSVWQGKYFLNGYGIQDNYFNPRNPTSSFRIFDPVSKTWKVTFSQIGLGYFVGTWEGKKEGDKIVLKQEQTLPSGQLIVSRLTFSNISDQGFDWISEAIATDGTTTAGWIQHCKKRVK